MHIYHNDNDIRNDVYLAQDVGFEPTKAAALQPGLCAPCLTIPPILNIKFLRGLRLLNLLAQPLNLNYAFNVYIWFIWPLIMYILI